MSDDDQQKKPQFELRDDGGVYFNNKGNSSLLAKYDEERGRVTFESFNLDQKYRAQILRAISEDAMTGELTGKRINGYAIAGRERDVIKKNEPPQPKKSKVLGDKTPEFVKWLFKWRPQAAYARFGVILDSNGEPRTAHCHRVERGLLLPDTGKALEIGADGKDALGVVEVDKEDGIIALRATCMTFLMSEVIQAAGDDSMPFEDEDDREADPGEDDGAEEKPAKKAGAGKGRAKADDDEDDKPVADEA